MKRVQDSYKQVPKNQPSDDAKSRFILNRVDMQERQITEEVMNQKVMITPKPEEDKHKNSVRDWYDDRAF